MEQKHTPGRWTADTNHRQRADGGWVSFAIKAADGKSVCACAATVKRDPAEIRANARLIQAAPDLLEALQELLALADEINPIEGRAMRKARAAISRALEV